jgi:hypothetical protein
LEQKEAHKQEGNYYNDSLFTTIIMRHWQGRIKKPNAPDDTSAQKENRDGWKHFPSSATLVSLFLLNNLRQ